MCNSVFSIQNHLSLLGLKLREASRVCVLSAVCCVLCAVLCAVCCVLCAVCDAPLRFSPNWPGVRHSCFCSFVISPWQDSLCFLSYKNISTLHISSVLSSLCSFSSSTCTLLAQFILLWIIFIIVSNPVYRQKRTTLRRPSAIMRPPFSFFFFFGLGAVWALFGDGWKCEGCFWSQERSRELIPSSLANSCFAFIRTVRRKRLKTVSTAYRATWLAQIFTLSCKKGY